MLHECFYDVLKRQEASHWSRMLQLDSKAQSTAAAQIILPENGKQGTRNVALQETFGACQHLLDIYNRNTSTTTLPH